MYVLLFALAVFLGAASVLLTLQRLVRVRQSRIVAAFLPLLGLFFYGDGTLGLLLILLSVWTTGRAIAACLPAGTTFRDFVAALRTSGNRRLFSHVFHFVAMTIASIFLLFKVSGGGDPEVKAQVLAKRIVARDGMLEARRAIPGALGFSRLHWTLCGVAGGIWIVLQLAHRATFATTFAASVPAVLLAAVWLLYGRCPKLGWAKKRARTSVATVDGAADVAESAHG
ncbi:hypothetical protein [Frigoribacterium sp. UYMn621]|uniref:hypothetical protein n=1 Tax=Frigoribacterium sp. UYMn621 TaxID=3156343 RepID=UPI00339B5665